VSVSDMVEVYVALDAIEVSAVTGLLESAGLEVRVRDMTITPYPISIGPLGEKRIFVPRQHAQEARRVLHQAWKDGFLKNEGNIIDDAPRG
jgi:hypothetical protein